MIFWGRLNKKGSKSWHWRWSAQCSGVKTNIGTGTKESTLISPTHAFCPSSYSSFFWKSTKIDASFPRPSWITITCRYCGRRRQGRGGFRGTGGTGRMRKGAASKCFLECFSPLCAVHSVHSAQCAQCLSTVHNVSFSPLCQSLIRPPTYFSFWPTPQFHQSDFCQSSVFVQ